MTPARLPTSMVIEMSPEMATEFRAVTERVGRRIDAQEARIQDLEARLAKLQAAAAAPVGEVLDRAKAAHEGLEAASVDQQRRAYAALGRIQTAVGFEIESQRSTDTTPKHLRVGVDSALIQIGAITGLLVGKGLISWDDFYTAFAVTAEVDVDDLRAKYPQIVFEPAGLPGARSPG